MNNYIIICLVILQILVLISCTFLNNLPDSPGGRSSRLLPFLILVYVNAIFVYIGYLYVGFKVIFWSPLGILCSLYAVFATALIGFATIAFWTIKIKEKIWGI
ncbi:hypothetical protein ACH0BF_16300 [Pseudobacillus sp. 179-B 2D1 NHS]|uniref:hypothetical protein n=1 Tax=Pseudobacillus sp. 179-B 2D1 NHS TaxID=3374292 RepID=UPI003879E088